MKIQTTTRGRGAFNYFELVVVIGVVVLLAVILLPELATAKHKSRIGCANYLKELDLAFKIWANDNNDRYPMEISVTNGGAMEFAEKGIAYPIFQVMSNEINTPKVLVCPQDKRHIAGTNFTTDFDNSKISYFIGLDANESDPQSILLGDDNLTVNEKPVSSGLLNLTTNSLVEWTAERHHFAGNIALADGSVQQETVSGLSNAILNSISATGAATNRLIIP